MIEEQIFAALSPMFEGRVYPDIAPADAVMPFILYRQAGGRSTGALCGGSGAYNAVFQFMVWSDTRQDASSLMRQAAGVLCGAPLMGVEHDSLIARYDDVTRTRAAMQDISFWYRPTV
jgi:hypothetical protein